MPFVLTRVSLVDRERTVAPGGVPVTLRTNQPIVWVRLSAWTPTPSLVPVTFPAVLDTGNNYSFLISAAEFRVWTGLDSEQLTPLRMMEANGVLVGCFAFNLELMRLQRGNPTDQIACQLQTDRGIVIIPENLSHRFPRMPVIGVRCLTINRLTFSLNGDRRTFSLWRPPVAPVQTLRRARRGSA
ncbi:MAG: hypothetical protein L0241_23605 [Planctomycetia bacterium]|nr:hypothetical protein [Planctomycetia bacterium]